MITYERFRNSVLAVTTAAVVLFAVGCDRSGDAPVETPVPAETAAPPAASVEAPEPPVEPAAAVATSPDVKAPISTPPRDDSLPKTTGGIGPRITFVRRTHDFGEIWDIGKQTTGFDFTNSGDDVLVVERVKTSCGCTATTLDKREYQPGEGSTLDVAFSPKGFGRQSKTIDVFTNVTEEPMRLSISAQIKQFIQIKPAVIRFGKVDLGQAHSQTVTVTSPDPNFEIISVTATARSGRSRDNFLLAELVDDPERPNSVEVTLSEETPWGAIYGSVTVTAKGRLEEGSDLITHSGRASVSAEVFGELQAGPNSFRIGSSPPGTRFEKEILLTRASGEPFQITRSEVEGARMPGLELEVIPITAGDDSGYRIRLVGDPGSYLGPVGGTVIIGTDVEGEEEMKFSIGGIIREATKR